MSMRVKRKGGSSKGGPALPTPSGLNNPMLKPSANQNNMMTYNAMYNVASVAPPAINQRPSRKAASRGGGGAMINQMPSIVTPPVPINPLHPGNQYSNSLHNNNMNIPNALNAPQMSAQGGMSDLQAKVAMWKQRRKTKEANSTVSLNAMVESQPRQAPGMFDATPEENEEDEDDGEEEEPVALPPPPPTRKSGKAASKVAAPPPTSAGVDQYQAEINLTVDSLRQDISSLRDELNKLTDTVKVLNPGNQAGIIKMVEQQVQKIVVEQNRLTGVLDQIQLMSKAQQNQLDEMAKNRHETEGIGADELDEIVEGLREEQKSAASDLEKEVKTALQTISDRSYWMYGLVLQEKVVLFESHELGSRKKQEIPKGAKVHLSYPMKRTNEGVWMKARTVSEDGSISVSWAPIWTFSPSVLQKFGDKQPPAEEEKIIYLGNFTLC